MDETSEASTSLRADNPADVAKALNALNEALDSLNKNMMAVTGVIAATIGLAARLNPKLREAADDGIQCVRTVMPGLALVDFFETMVHMASARPPTDGDGLPIDAAAMAENIIAFRRKAG